MLRSLKLVNRREIILSVLSAILLILSFPNFNFEFLAWFAFVPLFFALRNKSKAQAFFLSYLCGVIFWLGIVYWLANVTVIGMILLALYLAFYFGIFGLAARAGSCLYISSIWVLLEYLRNYIFTGFGWAFLGYSQYLNLPVIQIADITGVWGASFLIMMVNIAIYRVISSQLTVDRRIKAIVVPIVCVIATLIYGFFKVNLPPATYDLRPLKIAIIQGNIPQRLKWDYKAKDFIIDKYLDISYQAKAKNPGLIIWPEASLPIIPSEDPEDYEKILKLAEEIKIPLLIGAVTRENENYYNSALLISTDGKLTGQYDKLHLVPFGEYIPLRKILGFLDTVVPIGDFTRGGVFKVFNLPGNDEAKPVKFSVLICFEDVLPELSARFRKEGAGILINITNDGWFGETSAPYQHLSCSVFRAVENRVYVVRAANTGVSGFIAPNGKIIGLVRDNRGKEIFTSGFLEAEIISKNDHLSFYTRYTNSFILLCILFILYAVFKRQTLSSHV